MRQPYENFRSIASTFHSRSDGGFFCGLLKNTSYSIFSRRNCASSRVNSSSTVMHSPTASVWNNGQWHEVPTGHRRDRTKVSRSSDNRALVILPPRSPSHLHRPSILWNSV